MEMKASLCVGEYCETAYNIEELEIRVYCMEELCYCLKENAFLLDMSIMNDKLVDWIGEECRVRELAKQLYPMVHKQGSLSVFVLTILQYVGIYGEEELQAVAQVLKQGSGLSNLEKRKSQIDYMVEKENMPRPFADMICYWRPGVIWREKEESFRPEKSGRRSCIIKAWPLPD